MKYTYIRPGVEGKFYAEDFYSLVTNAAAWPQTSADHLRLTSEVLVLQIINVDNGHTALNALVLAINAILGLEVIEIHNANRQIFPQ